jgi:hypothetical protein
MSSCYPEATTRTRTQTVSGGPVAVTIACHFDVMRCASLSEISATVTAYDFPTRDVLPWASTLGPQRLIGAVLPSIHRPRHMHLIPPFRPSQSPSLLIERLWPRTGITPARRDEGRHGGPKIDWLPSEALVV